MMQSVGDLTLKGLHYEAASLNMTSRRQWLARDHPPPAGLYIVRTCSTRMYGVYRVIYVHATAELHSSTAESIHTQMERHTSKPFPVEEHTQTLSETH